MFYFWWGCGGILKLITPGNERKANNFNGMAGLWALEKAPWTSVCCRRRGVKSWKCLNPFTPKSDQCQISPAASAEILHHAVWRTWLFIASQMKEDYTTTSRYLAYTFFLKMLGECRRTVSVVCKTPVCGFQKERASPQAETNTGRHQCCAYPMANGICGMSFSVWLSAHFFKIWTFQCDFLSLSMFSQENAGCQTDEHLRLVYTHDASTSISPCELGRRKHRRKKKERALVLVLASSRFTLGLCACLCLCLCLRRTCKPA